jgi:hypothetical protein
MDVTSYNYMFRYMLRHHQNLYKTFNTRQYFNFFALYFSEFTQVAIWSGIHFEIELFWLKRLIFVMYFALNYNAANFFSCF